MDVDAGKVAAVASTFGVFHHSDGVIGVGPPPPLPGRTGHGINYVRLCENCSWDQPVRSQGAGGGDQSRPLPVSRWAEAASVISDKSPAGGGGLFSDLSRFSGRLSCRLLCSLPWSAALE